ncbi:class I SAM-dependent methyltransferase [Novosphingobium guangzhouense]|uniref:class I SAM-dependent methyltransferase n=1 Tax=Novosphingobium guangzhouense TaxID=1850347 RepID=UPI001FE2EE57|nr:methyltransferase domain-containing protein [Novosphingobium guangzhouense]
MKDTGWIAATEFVRHPSMVGSAFPASARMVRRMLAPLDWSHIEVLVEYGPGSGRFTFEMLRRMRPDAQLIAIETSQAFAAKLREKCDDPRLVVVEGSARDVRRNIGAETCGRADCILTGLPFSTLGETEADIIMHETALALKPTGVLAAYQMRTAIRRLIDRNFAQVRKGFEWCNIPPCHLYWAANPLKGSETGGRFDSAKNDPERVS